jgi:plastocyanin
MDTKVIWAIVGSFVVIIGLTGLLFWMPAKDSGTTDMATTTDESAVTPATGSTQGTGSAGVPAGAGARTFEKGVYVTTIFFTTKGFVPQSVVITHGEEVRFVNKTSLTMRVGSQVQSGTSSTYYSSISDPKSQPKGGTYQIALTQPGVWSYYSMTGDPFAGLVVVK